MKDLFNIQRRRWGVSVFIMSGLAVGMLAHRNAMFERWDINVWLGPFVLMASVRLAKGGERG